MASHSCSAGTCAAVVLVAEAALAARGGKVLRIDVVRGFLALGAAVLTALQLAATHWFYLYVVWFVPFVFVTIFGAYREAPAPAAAEDVRRPEAVTA